jgi:hypothetical protein
MRKLFLALAAILAVLAIGQAVVSDLKAFRERLPLVVRRA